MNISKNSISTNGFSLVVTSRVRLLWIPKPGLAPLSLRLGLLRNLSSCWRDSRMVGRFEDSLANVDFSKAEIPLISEISVGACV